MYESFLIIFREALEMALIVGIILIYLKRTNRSSQNNTVYLAIASGIGLSALLAYLFSLWLGSFTGKYEQLFEGSIMVLAAILITTMIFWFFRNTAIHSKLEERVGKYWDMWSSTGLFLIVFLSVLREGVEIVLFMTAIFLKTENSFAVVGSAFAGLFAALFLGYLIFVLGRKLPMKKFFLFSNVLLILFAAGLFAHGIHEFQEAGLVPLIKEHLFDINHILDEKGTIGSLLKAIFGYNGNPSLLETIAYFGYLGLVSVTFHLQKFSSSTRAFSKKR